jgi:hypothetical protein
MNDTPSKQMLEALFHRAEDYALFSMRRFGNVAPVMFTTTPEGDLWLHPPSLTDAQSKDKFANAARLICGAYEANAMVLVLEAWMKEAKPGETMETAELPSESLERQEVVMLMGEAKDGIMQQKFLPVLRYDNRKFFGFGESHMPKDMSFEGRFCHILPPKPLGAEGRELAKAMLEIMGITKAKLKQPHLKRF